LEPGRSDFEFSVEILKIPEVCVFKVAFERYEEIVQNKVASVCVGFCCNGDEVRVAS
jgi:hypothetical protein